MNNVLLGKTIKAMYKLSGKTLTQLSDETGLTVDTINNLFYARIQKPGLAGVNALVNAMGFSIGQLISFLDENRELPEDRDVTELFTNTVASAEGTNKTVPPAKTPVRPANAGSSREIELLREEHERELNRCREEQRNHTEQLREQYDRRIEQLEEHSRGMEQHYDNSVNELRSLHARETERLEKENARLEKTGRILGIVLSAETLLVLLFLILDVLNRGFGWFR